MALLRHTSRLQTETCAEVVGTLLHRTPPPPRHRLLSSICLYVAYGKSSALAGEVPSRPQLTTLAFTISTQAPPGLFKRFQVEVRLNPRA